jgi:hypothetical protein
MVLNINWEVYMKCLLLIVIFLFSTQSFSKDLSTRKELLLDIKEITKKCSIQLIGASSDNNQGKVVGFKSICPTLILDSEVQAHINIEGQWLLAQITESKESDGGDLYDLKIISEEGKVMAVKSNIPAYGNVVIAMGGGVLNGN